MQIDRDLHLKKKKQKTCFFLLGSQSKHKYNLTKAKEKAPFCGLQAFSVKCIRSFTH